MCLSNEADTMWGHAGLDGIYVLKVVDGIYVLKVMMWSVRRDVHYRGRRLVMNDFPSHLCSIVLSILPAPTSIRPPSLRDVTCLVRPQASKQWLPEIGNAPALTRTLLIFMKTYDVIKTSKQRCDPAVTYLQRHFAVAYPNILSSDDYIIMESLNKEKP